MTADRRPLTAINRLIGFFSAVGGQ